MAMALLAVALVGASPAFAQQALLELDTPFVTTPPGVVSAMLDLAKCAQAIG